MIFAEQRKNIILRSLAQAMTEISIIIPSYNHDKYIGNAINSVLNQSIEDWELIIVDDGSTDNSLETIKRFSDPRIHLFCQANSGAHSAINLGLRNSKGDYLAILNSDDMYHPKRLEHLLRLFEENPRINFAGSHIQIIDDSGKKLSIKHGYQDSHPWALAHPEKSFRQESDLRLALLTENYWATTSNFIFTRTIFEEIGEFRPLRYAHDWDYALRAAAITPLLMIPEALLQYRIHQSNTIREDTSAMIFEICWILAMHLPQYIRREDFLNQASWAERTDQLLSSIYTYGMERVLSVMLLQTLPSHSDFALALLEPTNPVRDIYLDFIRENVNLNELNSEQVMGFFSKVKTTLSRMVPLY